MSRTPPPLPEFRFANGVTVQYRPLSQFFLNKLRLHVERQLAERKPQPPVEHGDFGNFPNTQDPAYVQALTEHLELSGIRVLQAALEVSVFVEPDELTRGLDAYAAEHAAYQSYLAAHELEDVPTTFDTHLDGVTNQIVRYIFLVGAAGNSMELVRLMNAIYLLDGSMEARVRATQAAFPGDLPRNGHLEAAPPTVGAGDP